jgi:D-glycero-D-manno-heptose 1,7-bisphosphate phosphatase
LSPARLAPGRTVFLDRDGTINESPPEGEYLSSADDVRLIPGAAEAIRILNQHPAKVVVVTNQRGIALGKMTEADLSAVNERIASELARSGARLDGIFHCPHHAGTCECRKPGTGMFEQAAREIEGVGIEGGAMVGDSAIDIEAGRRLSLTTVRLGASDPGDPAADHEAPSLLEAVRRLTVR